MLGERISTHHYAELLEHGRNISAPWLRFDPAVLQSSYNRKPFLIQHRLVEQPYFSLGNLFALCRRMDPEQIHYRIGDIPGDANFDTSYERYRQGLTLEDALQNFEAKRAYVCIYNPERDSTYKPVIEGLLAEIAAQVDPLEPGITWYSTYIFMSTRDSVTPYHMDREMNFLLQIQGSKTVYLWDPADDEIMSAEQKDYLLSRIGDRPPYRPAFESKAMTFDLRPGFGVHHPFIAPHRVHTGSDLSVSLAFTFRTRTSDIWTDAHRANAVLRRLGMNPRPVRRSAMADRTKSGLIRMTRSARRAFRQAEQEAT